MLNPVASRLAQTLALFVFFCSGTAGLVYEISWSRQFGNVFGHTVFTAANVLFSFLGGMALGYWLAGRTYSSWRPLAAYGWLEICAGAWALVVPTILKIDSGLLQSNAMRAIFSFTILLPATAALGATWPLMAAFLSTPDCRTPRLLSAAYALNTAGSLIGSYFATTYLLANVGVVASSQLASFVSILCGVFALLLSRLYTGSWRQAIKSQSETTALAPEAETLYRKWLAFAALSGFSILALEVIYFRLFSLVFHNSTYTFGAVVTVFLFSLALGSAITSIIGSRFSATTLAAIACGVGSIGIILSLGLFVRRTGFQYFSEGATFAAYSFAALQLITTVIALPITALGMLLPLAWRALNQHLIGPSQVAGLTAASTLAGAVGSLAASFILLPYLGLWISFLFIALIYLTLATLIMLQNRQRVQWLITLFAIIAIGNWSWSASSSAQTLLPGDTLLRRWEGPYGWVDVVKAPDNALAIRQNLHYAFGSSMHSVERDYRQGHLPLLFHPNPKVVAYLGMGTGQTAAAATEHPELNKIVVVELIPEAVEAAKMFAETNLNLLNNPRVEIIVDDARRYLRASNTKHDVIVADLYVPWESHTGYLYTVEHYQAAKRSLNSNGIFCQWLPLYQVGPADFELIADSFASVFPNTTLWWAQIDSSRAVVGLIGSDTALDLETFFNSRKRLASIPGRKTGGDTYLASNEAVLSLYIGKWIIRKPDWLNTDEHPRVEFSAPISHGNNHKLQGWIMRGYYSDVLAKLPDAGIVHTHSGGQAMSRAWRTIEHRRLLTDAQNTSQQAPLK